MGHFDPENGAYLHNSESTLRFFKKFLQMKGVNRYINILLLFFKRKKIHFGPFDIFSL